MRKVRPSVICDRVRSQVSLELDGELSQLERAMVAAHLERCPDCRAYKSEVTTFTGLLRQAPLKEMESPVVVRKPHRTIAARLQAGVAAAVAVAALGAASQVAPDAQGPAGSPSESRQIQYPSLRQIEREQAILQSVNSGNEIRLVLDGYVI
jgi:anti-sigma factor RsiW